MIAVLPGTNIRFNIVLQWNEYIFFLQLLVLYIPVVEAGEDEAVPPADAAKDGKEGTPSSGSNMSTEAVATKGEGGTDVTGGGSEGTDAGEDAKVTEGINGTKTTKGTEGTKGASTTVREVTTTMSTLPVTTTTTTKKPTTTTVKITSTSTVASTTIKIQDTLSLIKECTSLAITKDMLGNDDPGCIMAVKIACKEPRIECK